MIPSYLVQNHSRLIQQRLNGKRQGESNDSCRSIAAAFSVGGYSRLKGASNYSINVSQQTSSFLEATSLGTVGLCDTGRGDYGA